MNEPDVLNTFCATRIWKLKILQRMHALYELFSASATNKFNGFWKTVSPWLLHSPELRHGSHLHDMFWTFFLHLVFFLKRWPLIAYLYAKWFFSDNLLYLRDHVIDHALNWKKYDHLSYKVETYRKLSFYLSKP